MADENSQVPPETPKKREPPQAVKDFLANVHNKSFRRLAREDFDAKEAERNKLPEEKPEVEKPEEKPETPPTPPEEHKEETPAIKPEELVAKTAKETATEVAKEIAKIQEDKKLTEAEKQTKTDELRANWKGVDKDGKPAPVSWEEVLDESVRIAEKKMQDFYRQQKEAELDEMKKIQTQEQDKKAADEKAYQERVTQVNDRVNQEMEELYASGKLAKPKDLNDDKDPAAKKVQDLFKQAIAYNEAQKTAGKPLIDSIAKFYFLYYKPTEATQPPGADAPISGSQAAPSENNERFDYMKDIHKPSFRQILTNARRAIGRKQ